MAPQVENAPQADGLTGAAPQPTPSGVQNKATQALRHPRLPIRTAQLEGSIALIGARIDDLTLTAYRQSIDENAASQKVLQPAIGETYWQARMAGSPLTVASPCPMKTRSGRLSRAQR